MSNFKSTVAAFHIDCVDSDEWVYDFWLPRFLNQTGHTKSQVRIFRTGSILKTPHVWGFIGPNASWFFSDPTKAPPS